MKVTLVMGVMDMCNEIQANFKFQRNKLLRIYNNDGDQMSQFCVKVLGTLWTLYLYWMNLSGFMDKFDKVRPRTMCLFAVKLGRIDVCPNCCPGIKRIWINDVHLCSSWWWHWQKKYLVQQVIQMWVVVGSGETCVEVLGIGIFHIVDQGKLLSLA